VCPPIKRERREGEREREWRSIESAVRCEVRRAAPTCELDDLTQEVVVQLLRRRREAIENVLAYARTVARTQCSAFLRRMYDRRTRTNADAAIERTAGSDGEESVRQRAERILFAWAATADLSPRERRTMACLHEARSSRELAREVGIDGRCLERLLEVLAVKAARDLT
jgi:RNA polymerase sigma factor (sigma-70 family)